MVKNKTFVIQLFVLGLGVAFLTYGWFVRFAYFFSDDFTWLWYGKQVVADPRLIFSLRAATNFSPVMNAVSGAIYWFVGPRFPAYFIFGLLVHTGVAFLSGILSFRLTASRVAGFLTAALVALAGGAYEPVIWIGAGMHSLAAFVIVAAVVCYFHARETGKKLGLAASFAFVIIALATKETAVVIPILLIGAALIERGKEIRLDKRWHRAFAISVGCIWIAYLVFEYLWQRANVITQNGVWHLGFDALLRLPTTILGMIISTPAILTDLSAPFVAIVVTAGLVFIFKKFWELPAVKFGAIWMVASLLPTMFFAGDHWWTPLASRYMYLPRIGLAVALGAIVLHLFSKTKKLLIFGVVSAVFAAAVIQSFFIISLFGSDYAYVYKTGRSLAYAASLLRGKDTVVLVSSDHPFNDNNAHIIAALNIFGGVEPERVVFAPAGQTAVKSSGQVILEWNAERRDYILR